MPRKFNKSDKDLQKDVLENRKAHAKAMTEILLSQPEFEQVYNRLLLQYKKAAIEFSKQPGCPPVLKEYYERLTPEGWKQEFSLTPAARELLKRYGLLKDMTWEDFALLAESAEDFNDPGMAILAHIALPDGGRAAIPIKIEDQYLYLKIDLKQPIKSILAETQNIVKAVEKELNIKKISTPPKEYQVEIHKKLKKGIPRIIIKNEIEKEKSYEPEGDGAGKNVDRSKKKILNYLESYKRK
jgi:hypothetical protein